MGFPLPGPHREPPSPMAAAAAAAGFAAAANNTPFLPHPTWSSPPLHPDLLSGQNLSNANRSGMPAQGVGFPGAVIPTLPPQAPSFNPFLYYSTLGTAALATTGAQLALPAPPTASPRRVDNSGTPGTLPPMVFGSSAAAALSSFQRNLSGRSGVPTQIGLTADGGLYGPNASSYDPYGMAAYQAAQFKDQEYALNLSKGEDLHKKMRGGGVSYSCAVQRVGKLD